MVDIFLYTLLASSAHEQEEGCDISLRFTSEEGGSCHFPMSLGQWSLTWYMHVTADIYSGPNTHTGLPLSTQLMITLKFQVVVRPLSVPWAHIHPFLHIPYLKKNDFHLPYLDWHNKEQEHNIHLLLYNIRGHSTGGLYSPTTSVTALGKESGPGGSQPFCGQRIFENQETKGKLYF